MLTNDDLKRYSVIVEDGSGCLFQPMTEEYTYILTAKHLFYSEIENEQGQNIKTKKRDGENIEILQMDYVNGIWVEKVIPFKLQPNENYFEHNDADIAILKIPYQEGFNQITVKDIFEQDNGFLLCGFPNTLRKEQEGERHKSIEVERFGPSNNYTRQAYLPVTFQKNDIDGFSGGGILKLNHEGIFIVGIQSKMATPQYASGEIGFVPMEYAKEIIEQNSVKLSMLFPNTLLHFKFLRDKAFILDVDLFNIKDADDVRTTLLNKAQNIITSDITPFEIKQLFNRRLLMDEKNDDCLTLSSLWLAWFEFLTIMNLMKYDNISLNDLSNIFNRYCLKYVNTDDWTDENVRKDYGKANYIGVLPNSTVIVSSKQPPKTTFRFPKGKLIDISRPYDRFSFKVDKGLDPFTSFEFVHIEYFKIKCIVHKLEEYRGLSEPQIIDKLKEVYNDLFK